MFIGAKYHQQYPETFRTSRELKNMILSINFAIKTFFFFFFIYLFYFILFYFFVQFSETF